jgi:hypothetical protein
MYLQFASREKLGLADLSHSFPAIIILFDYSDNNNFAYDITH